MFGVFYFEEDEDDEYLFKKGYKCYLDIGDSVVIGVGIKVFGVVFVGDYVSIGVNLWVIEDVLDYMSVYILEYLIYEWKYWD